MKAVRLCEGNEIRVEEAPEPSLGSGKIRVAIRTVAPLSAPQPGGQA